MTRLGWALVALGLLVVPPAMDSLWLVVPCALLWTGAVLVAEAYADGVRTVSLSEAADLIDAQRRPS